MSDRDLRGDAVEALCVLLDVDLADLPEALVALREALAERATDERRAWERIALGGDDHDHDAAERARRWAKAIDAAWELAARELDIASGRRRAGGTL